MDGNVLKESLVQQFSIGLDGRLLRPGDEGYDASRRVFNGMIDKYPALIAKCSGVKDVINAVNFARKNKLLLAVKAGGHNVAGNAVCDGGLLIDLSNMKGIRVDPERRTARAEGGVTWAEFDKETQVFGLATTGGIVSMTGIAGLTLGGGIGWLARKWGLACDNLLSADVVTSDGRLMTASADENADLFWGVRGGGGNFGIATSFEFRLHPVGPVLAGLLIYPFEKAKDVLEFYREFTGTTPDELTCYLVLGSSPDGDPIAVIVLSYNGTVEEGERVLKRLRMFGPPMVDQIAPMGYTKLQSMLDGLYPSGNYHYWKSNFLKGLAEEAIDTMVSRFAARPNPMCHVAIEHMGGAMSRIGPNETAFNHRDAPYDFLILGVSANRAESEKSIKWARDFWEAMQPFSTGGVYVNYLGQEADEGTDRIKTAYAHDNFDRLVALKNKYDPANLFRLNQNIKPTAPHEMATMT